MKAGVSQGADKSAGIAAAVNYVDQNDKAEAELAGDIKSKGDVKVSAETKRPWQSNLEGFGENLADDLATIFDPNNGFELSYLTDSWTQTVGAAHVKNTNSVAATTTAHVREGSQLLEGETEKAKEKDKTASYTGAAQSPYSSAYKGGSIAVGTRNDAELDSDTLVDVYGAAGYADSENRVTYTGLSNTSFAGSAETAKGDISAMAGRDSRGETGTIRTSAHSDILNATAIPISIKKDPVAKIDSRASLTVDAAANMRSDRDIHMKAKAGSLTALGSGEVKDWVNKVADALGADGSSIGRKEISSSADVTMDGKAETGIHRNKSITIGGQDKQGSWETTVKSDGDISYIYGGGTTIVGKELSERLAALREKLADFGADDSTKAAYEAEIQFLEEKMAA